MIEKICLFCNKQFFVKNVRKDTAKYCSKKCNDISPIRTEAIRNKQKGREVSLAKRLQLSNTIKQKWKEGIYTDERNKKISRTLTGTKRTEKQRKNYSVSKQGEKNPQWQGGICEKKYPKEFNNNLKEKIKQRDCYQCQLCFENKKLEVHHMNYDKNNCEENNLITLCKSCHSRTNSNRDIWEPLLVKNLTYYQNTVKKIIEALTKERDNILRFFQHYHFLTREQRKEICTSLPRFMNPNFNSETEGTGDNLEPYSWDVAFYEIIENTELGKDLINSIEWDKK